MLILLPALFAIMFLGVQAALYYHARTVAIAAAQEGARAAGAEHAAAADGVGAARSYLEDAGGQSILEHPRVSADRTPVTATVTITGTSLSVIPGWTPSVRQSASVTVERLTAP